MPSEPQIRTIALAWAAAFAEGMDLQSAGIAGPGMKGEFGFSPAMLGLIFSTSFYGLICGSAIGGRLADFFGRKRVLTVSVFLLGFFSIATAISWNSSTLLLARFATGLALGGALPNLVALAAESVSPGFRNKAVAIAYCGIPLGATAMAFVARFIPPEHWREIFYLGGAAALAVGACLEAMMSESALFLVRSAERSERMQGVGMALFGGRRGAATLLLWVAIFFTPAGLNLLINWLPTLLAARGLSHVQATTAQMALNIGSAVGILAFGVVMDSGGRRVGVIAAFCGVIAGLLLLSFGNGFGTMMTGAASSGLFLSACILVLTGAAPAYYPTLMRGTGTGAALGVSRFGSSMGALIPGTLLGAGLAPVSVLLAGIPGILAALAATLTLFRRAGAAD